MAKSGKKNIDMIGEPPAGDREIETKRRRKSSKLAATDMGLKFVDDNAQLGVNEAKNLSTKPTGVKGRTSVTKNRADEKKAGNAGKGSSRFDGLRRATHKRFESPEIELHPCELGSTKSADRHTGESDDSLSQAESEGDAPETVTAAAGLDQSRALLDRAARAVGRQKAATNQKRKEHDTRLKLQAQSRKRKIEETRSETAPESVDNNMGSIPTHSQIYGNPESQTALPALLPDSILLAEPPSPNSNYMPSLKPTPSKSKKLLALISKAPRDLKHGSKTIRVLQNSRTLLPPPVSKPSKALRESWLSGSRDGEGFVPRRKVGGGFVRKIQR